MSKRIAIIIIVIILAITAIVYVGIWNAKKETTVNQDKPISTKQQTKETTDNTTARETAKSADSDISGIESDLNSMSDDSFAEDTLSDSEVGL